MPRGNRAVIREGRKERAVSLSTWGEAEGRESSEAWTKAVYSGDWLSPPAPPPLLHRRRERSAVKIRVKHQRKHHKLVVRKVSTAEKYFQNLLESEKRPTKLYVSYESILKNYKRMQNTHKILMN